METKLSVVEKESNVMETNFKGIELYILDKKELYNIYGGGHLEVVNGEWKWIE